MRPILLTGAAAVLLGLSMPGGAVRAAETAGDASGAGDALTQRAVLERLLRDNPRAQASRLEADIAGTQVDFEEGAYQASFFSRLQRSDEERPNSAEDEATEVFDSGITTFKEQRTELEFGVRAPLRTGGEFSLAFSGVERDNTYTEEIQPGASEYVGGVDVSLRQPLWRNLMSRERELLIDQAEAGEARSREQSRQQLLEVAFQGLRQYWLVHRRQQFHAIDATALETARDTVAVTQQLVDGGIQPALAAMEVEARVIEREAELRRSASAMAEARAELAILLNREGEGEAIERFEAIDTPETRLIERPASLKLYATQVLGQWPQFRAARLTREAETHQLDLARESGKPTLDMVLGYSTSALDRSSSEALGDSFDSRHPSWYFGFELDVKIGANQQSDAQANAAVMRMTQADVDMQATRVSVLNRLRTRLEQAESAHEQMQLMTRRETLQEAIYREQEGRFQAGQIAANALHDAMDDLIDVQRKAVDARVAYQLALIALRLVEGSLFAEYGLDALADGLATPANPPRLELIDATDL